MRPFILTIALLLGWGQASVNAQVFVPSSFGGSTRPSAYPYSPFGFGTSGYGMGGYGSNLGYPFYPSGYGVNGPNIFPGFGASTQARMRPTVYPAIHLPSPEVIEAKLFGDEVNRATLTINVPTSNARVWLEGVLMNQTGERRQFVTPPLNPASDYVFQVRVEWENERGTQSRTRKLAVTPGADRTITIR